MDEIRKAIRQLRNNKAPGYDDIPAELLKADIETASEVLFVLFKHIWQEEQIPDDWHKGFFVIIPRRVTPLNVLTGGESLLYQWCLKCSPELF